MHNKYFDYFKCFQWLIGDYQTGFMAGRNILTNIRRTIDLITHVYESGKRALIVSVDFEKCFDRLSHKSMFKMLEFFQFGDIFTNWVRLFFNDFLVCTQNAGYLSKLFVKGRGCNQGCPISPFLMIGCGKIMAQMIINNPRIKGISMYSTEHIITQFADDTGLFLEYEEHTLMAVMATFNSVEKLMGLKVSYDKSTIYRIGSLRDSNAQLYCTKQLKWSSGDIEMLGITINNAKEQSNDLSKIYGKMDSVSNAWYYRSLTLMGKTLVINTLMSSLFVYQLSVAPMISDSDVKLFNDKVKRFLWKGRKSKIPLHILQKDKTEGGLKLCDIRKRHLSLRIKWIQYLHESDILQSYVYN